MQNINVTTTVTTVLEASNSPSRVLLLQNQSDTTLLFSLTAANTSALTSALGFKLEAGESLILSGSDAAQKISAIHGGTGSKVLHYQFL